MAESADEELQIQRPFFWAAKGGLLVEGQQPGNEMYIGAAVKQAGQRLWVGRQGASWRRHSCWNLNGKKDQGQIFQTEEIAGAGSSLMCLLKCHLGRLYGAKGKTNIKSDHKGFWRPE